MLAARGFTVAAASISLRIKRASRRPSLAPLFASENAAWRRQAAIVCLYVIWTVTTLLPRPPITSCTGQIPTAGGNVTLTWYKPTKPGAAAENCTTAGAPQIVTCGNAVRLNGSADAAG